MSAGHPRPRKAPLPPGEVGSVAGPDLQRPPAVQRTGSASREAFVTGIHDSWNEGLWQPLAHMFLDLTRSVHCLGGAGVLTQKYREGVDTLLSMF